NISNPSGATVARSQGTATIIDDDGVPTPGLSVGDTVVVEGDSGTRVARFTVFLSQPVAQDVFFDYATSNLTAATGSDFTPRLGNDRADRGYDGAGHTVRAGLAACRRYRFVQHRSHHDGQYPAVYRNGGAGPASAALRHRPERDPLWLEYRLDRKCRRQLGNDS